MRVRKGALLLALYFCQGLPGGFLAVALPVMMREQGASFTIVGFAAWLNLPWVIKFLWAPLADRIPALRFGRRKIWILPAQLGMILVTLAFAFVIPETELLWIAVGFLLLNFLAATQDIGVDGLAVDSLSKRELGAGNTTQVSGFKLGNIVGGGVLLSLAATIGWRGDFLIMALAVAATAVFLLFTRETSLYAEDRSDSPPATLRDLFAGLKAAGLGLWLFLFYAKFAETFGGALVKPVLVDHGFARGMIGLLDGTIGGIATVAGGVAAGLVYWKIGLRTTFVLFTLVQGLFLILFGLATIGEISFGLAATLNGIENFAGGATGVCALALAMAACPSRVGAGMFTLFQCIYTAGAFAGNPLSGVCADQVGPLAVFAAGGVMTLSLAPILLWTRLSQKAAGTALI